MASSEHLDKLLKRAALEPGTRWRFLKKLLKSNAFVFIHHPAGEAQTVWNSRTVAWIRNDGMEVIPLFTSEAALAKAPIPGKAAFSVHVQSLLEAHPNTHCHVNPGSTYDVPFSADELAHALTSIAEAGGATTLMLGARENAAIANTHPSLTAKLMAFLAGVSQVERAYFLEAELNQPPSRPMQIAVLVTDGVQITEAISKIVEGLHEETQPARVRTFFLGSPEYVSIKASGIAPFYDREWNMRLLAVKPNAIS
jgi:hypothetical protein